MDIDKKKHILLDNIFNWCLSLCAFAFGIWQNSIDIIIFNTVLSIGFFVRSFRWLMYCYDKIFKRKVTIKTKGYRFFKREPIYMMHVSPKLFYSEIFFDDPKLNGKFILLEDNFALKHGDLLEVTYYKNSKVIETISTIAGAKVDSED